MCGATLATRVMSTGLCRARRRLRVPGYLELPECWIVSGSRWRPGLPGALRRELALPREPRTAPGRGALARGARPLG